MDKLDLANLEIQAMVQRNNTENSSTPFLL